MKLWVAEFENVVGFVFAWWRHVMTSCHDVKNRRYSIWLSQLVDVLARWLFFCFYSILGWQVQKYHWFCILHMWLCHAMTLWRHGMTIWRNILTLSILACGVAREIPCPCIHGFLDHSIRKCHSISTAMVTSLYAVTSWSWRLVTIS